MRSTGNWNLDLDFKIRIPDLQSNAKSENGRFFTAEICVLEFPFFPRFFFGGGRGGGEGGIRKRTAVFGFPNRTGKRKYMKSGFGILNKNPPCGRISRRRNPFSDFAFGCKKSKIRISKSKSGFPNRKQQKKNSSSLVYVLHKTWSFFTSKSCRRTA